MKKEDKLILINHRINKSHLTIDDAKFSLENNKTSIALNRIYYSIFYIVSALALIYDFSTSKHKQLLGWFNKNFIFTGILENKLFKIYSLAFDKRQESDYEDFPEINIDAVQKYYEDALYFINKLESFINEKIKAIESNIL